MPRSSRTKSHKQNKHNSSKEYSGSDDDVKPKEKTSTSINGGKDDTGLVRVSVSGDKRKHGKDLLKDMSNSHGNGGNADRWNGGSSDDKGSVINVEDKELVKPKVVGESKEDKELVKRKSEKDESKKRKSEKEYVRKEKEYKEYKDYKETKEKDRGSDRGRKGRDEKAETEALSKQVESKKGKEVTEWSIEEELRNPELEKELEKRMRRRGEASSARDKYQDDIKETEDRHLSTRNDRSKDERHKNEDYGDIRESRKKDEKHREDGEHDRKSRDVKHRDENERYNKHRDDKYDKYREDKYSEDGNKETKYKDDKYVENSEKDERSRDRKRRQDDDRDYKHKEEKRARDSKYRDVPEPKRVRDDNVRKTNDRDGSPVYDDRSARYKDDKDRRRGNEKDEPSDYRSRSSMKERSESEKRTNSKVDSVSEWGRHDSRYPTRDHHRYLKQEETKYRDYAYEDRGRHHVHSSKDYESAPVQSDKKVISKDDGYAGGDISGDKRVRPESRSSLQVDKSPPSTSNEHRNFNKSDARKSLDLEEPGPRSGSIKDTGKDGKGSRELVGEAQVDNDNLSVSSPYMRNSHFSGNSKSLLPPPSPSTFGSTEDDRSKTNNRHRRMTDPNMNRGQGQSQSQGSWTNVPNWPSPMAPGGYIPFPHVPPPMFHHPLMPQFPPQMFGRPPMKLNPGLPYPVPDNGRQGPPPMHGWDANNPVYGDEPHLYGRLDWDHRTQLSNRVWDQSGEMWKNQNAGNMEQSGQQQDGYPGQKLNDEKWSGPTGQPDEGEQNQPDMQETLNLDKNGPEVQKVTESSQIFEVAKEDNNALISQAYLSRVDVSKDLTQPELYDQYTNMMDLDQEALSDEFDCKILFSEEGVYADVTNSASLFAVMNESVFEKAMLLYKKQKEDFSLMNTDKEKGGSDDDKSAYEMAVESTVMEASKENDEAPNKPEEAINTEVDDAVVKQEEEEHESTEVAVKDIDDATESINEETNGGGDGLLVLSDVSTADVAVMPTESIEFGSVNLNRIHHHSPESTH